MASGWQITGTPQVYLGVSITVLHGNHSFCLLISLLPASLQKTLHKPAIKEKQKHALGFSPSLPMGRLFVRLPSVYLVL